MSENVNPTQGPTGAPEGQKAPSSADVEKFKVAMKEQMSTVKAVDPDEQKKRKSQQELEEEIESNIQAAIAEQKTAAPSEPPPFQITQSPEHIDLLALDKTGAMQSLPPPHAVYAQNLTPTEETHAPKAVEPAAASSQGDLSHQPPPKTPVEAPAQSPPPFSMHTPEMNVQPVKSDDVTTRSTSMPTPPSVQVPAGHAAPPPKAAPLTPEEEPTAVGAKKGGGEKIKAGFAQQTSTEPDKGAPLKPEQLRAQNPYSKLPPEVQELFDRMVGVMTVMQLSGIKETSFTLNLPQFASSVFFGTRIIIQEFSTAPQEFNIQLRGSGQAVDVMHKNTAQLMNAFQAGKYNFRVHRLETQYNEGEPHG